MNLQIQAQNFPLTDGLREHVSTRFAYSLNHGRDVVTRIVVRLSDVNGPRGGADKCCGIEVRLKGAPPLVVEDTQTDLYVAIDRAADRMGRALATWRGDTNFPWFQPPGNNRSTTKRHEAPLRHGNDTSRQGVGRDPDWPAMQAATRLREKFREL
jgi:putative sigma-54 modulation protein